MKNNIIYHSADLDGWCSGAIMRKAVEEMNTGIPINMIPWDHGNEIPVLEGPIYMADISFPSSVMETLAGHSKRMGRKFVWIDHHLSAINDSIKYGYDDVAGSRKVGDSASLLAWRYFFGHDIPQVVKFIDLYDVWKKKNDFNIPWEEIIAYQFGLRGCIGDPIANRNYYQWLDFFKQLHASVYNEGSAIIKYQRSLNKQISKNAFELKFHGLTFLVVNHKGNSETLASVATDKYDGLMLFSYESRFLIRVSMYKNELNNESIDLSIIAKRMGGGGHASACGFEINCLDDLFDDTVFNDQYLSHHPGFLGDKDFKICMRNYRNASSGYDLFVSANIPDGWDWSNKFDYEENPDKYIFTFSKIK